jgi:GNAT superfamily N-acetyltransferase
VEIETRETRRPAPLSLRRRMRVERGSRRDYHTFAAMHYRSTDELGFVSKVFVLREGAANTSAEPLGIVVYSHPPIELSLRNQATNKRFSRRPKALNKHVRILRRLVIHPDVRGCGLGHYLVRKTLLQVGTRYVECLAALGEINPVFEKAGMRRIGTCPEPPKRREAIRRLDALGIDPTSRSFPMLVNRRTDVRAIVAAVVHDWYTATTGGGERRVERQSPFLLAETFRGLIGSRPVYYLWEKPATRSA